MDQLFILENDQGGVAVGYPSPEALETIGLFECAKKGTPKGKPFWIVDEEYIPNDHTFFNAWELDIEALGEPTGYCMDYEDWVLEYKK